jgi:hypothetical protein
MALVIHLNFETEFTVQLSRFGIKTLADFDPLKTAILRDPKFADCDLEARTTATRKLYRNGIIRAVQFVRAAGLLSLEPVNF